jgi:hypothetical protein
MRAALALCLILSGCASRPGGYSDQIAIVSASIDTALQLALTAYSAPGSHVTDDELRRAQRFARAGHESLALMAKAVMDYQSAVAANPGVPQSQAAILAALSTANENLVELNRLIAEWRTMGGKPAPVARRGAASLLDGVCVAGSPRNATGLFCASPSPRCCDDASGSRSFARAALAEARLAPPSITMPDPAIVRERMLADSRRFEFDRKRAEWIKAGRPRPVRVREPHGWPYPGLPQRDQIPSGWTMRGWYVHLQLQTGA